MNFGISGKFLALGNWVNISPFYIYFSGWICNNLQYWKRRNCRIPKITQYLYKQYL